MERDAFRRLGPTGQHGMVAFYGSFVQEGSFAEEENYNILLEYCDFGNLEEYIQKTASPESFMDLLNFWRELLKVIEALKRIHNVNENGAPRTGVLQGYVLFLA